MSCAFPPLAHRAEEEVLLRMHKVVDNRKSKEEGERLPRKSK